MTRLKTLAPRLVEGLARASKEQVRTIVMAACRSAVQGAGLQSNDVSDALARLQQHEPPAQGQAEKIAALSDNLDDRYFALQESSDRGNASADEHYLAVFSQARAASAVVFAIKDDSLESSMEAIYEAAMATESPEQMARELEDLLK